MQRWIVDTVQRPGLFSTETLFVSNCAKSIFFIICAKSHLQLERHSNQKLFNVYENIYDQSELT